MLESQLAGLAAQQAALAAQVAGLAAPEGGGRRDLSESQRWMGLGVPKKEALKKKAAALSLQATAFIFEVETWSLKLEEMFFEARGTEAMR